MSAEVREVLWATAAAFWLEGTHRTVPLHPQHDTVPTGPPYKTPPNHLRGEEAQWVDDQLQEEVDTGQLERGNSEWASPPSATKVGASHKTKRRWAHRCRLQAREFKDPSSSVSCTERGLYYSEYHKLRKIHVPRCLQRLQSAS